MYNPLLNKLQRALSPIYGNTLLTQERQYDEYFCKVCHDRVSEDKYNHKHSICFGCFYGEEI